jgi:glutamate synthase (NADPH/NADH) small chain
MIELEADVIFVAIGFDPLPLPRVAPFEHIGTGVDRRVAVDENQMTSVAGVFAGGDLVRGPTPVLQAVRDARRAAEGIDSYLAAMRVGRTA